MKRFIGSIGDRLQATFPPNRVMLVVAPAVTAASLWLSAWLTAHVPGVELPAGVIAGAMGVVGLLAVTLFYKWFDQWQKGEQIDPGYAEQALEEVLAEPAVRAALFEAQPDLFAAVEDVEAPPVAASSSTEETAS